MSRATFVALLALALGAGCTSAASGGGAVKEHKAQTDVTAEDYVSPALPTGRVVLHDAYGAPHVVEVEIVATHDLRTRGLMWRRHLAPGKGMLFVFGEDEVHSFWMKNTLIPLDMFFIELGGTVVHVVENASPRTLDPRGGDKPSRFVLEVPGGWAGQQGIRSGSMAELHLPPDLAVEL